MKIYADRVPTAARQVITDLLVVAWVYAAIRAAMWVHDLVQKLAVPGQQLEGAGSGLADGLSDIGGKIDQVPVVGDELTAPFRGAADAARSLADAGQQQQDVVSDLALTLSLGLLVFPLGLVLFVWLPLRLRWMRRAGAAARLRSAAAGRDLLAFRALATQPLTKLTKIDPDVAQSWRRADEETLNALAALELKALGLRP